MIVGLVHTFRSNLYTPNLVLHQGRSQDFVIGGAKRKFWGGGKS